MIYIAFLRAINVGGKNKIKMSDLKKELEDIGLLNVQTYIQSGNIVFESANNKDTLKSEIQRLIENKFSIKTEVTILLANELFDILDSCPYTKEEIDKAYSINPNGENLYVALLNEMLSDENIETLQTRKTKNESFRIKGHVIYMLFFDSIRNSKITGIIQKIDPSATVRNVSTMKKLCSLVKNSI